MRTLSLFRIVFLSINISQLYIALGLLMSLQPPFYPSEAQKKGATPSQYGFVFGISNPIFGHFGSKLGAKFCFISGSLLQGISGLVFAFLADIGSLPAFLGLSYFLRFLEGIGTACGWSSSFGVLLKIYPSNVTQVMSWTQSCFGLGYTFGPAVGAFLYNIGGFKLPFLVVGTLNTCLALLLIFSIPFNYDFGSREDPQYGTIIHDDTSDDDASSNQSTSEKLGFGIICRDWLLLLPLLELFIGLCGNGMIESMLEPHLREQIGANERQVAMAFLIYGLCYMFGNILVGAMAHCIQDMVWVALLGNFLFVVFFIFIGPTSFILVKSSVPLAQAMMSIGGTAYSSIMVSSFVRAQSRVLKLGYPDDVHTYIMISSVWMSAFAAGNFVGPTIAGILVQLFNFSLASLVFAVLYLWMIALDVICILHARMSRRNDFVFY